MLISSFLVYDSFDADLDAITIYKRIKTLPDLSKLVAQTLLTFLRGFMTSTMVNDTGTFIPSIVFMDSSPPEARTWGLNKFIKTVTTLCSSHQDPGPDSAPPAASSDINLTRFNTFSQLSSSQGYPLLPPSTAALQNPPRKIFTPCAGRKSIFISKYSG